MSDEHPSYSTGAEITPEQEAEHQRRKAELVRKFEELKELAREERGGKTYSSKEVLDMIMRKEKDDQK